mgnify:CR=1 FL=1
MNLKKIKTLLADILYISKATKVNNKKLRILASSVLTNITAGLDILIIIMFSDFFIKTTYDNFLIEFFLNNKNFLIIIVLLRFLTIYLDKLNVFSLQLSISENLKVYLLKDIYKKGNYSIADATYHITKLTEHIAYFYGALSNTISGLLQVTLYIIFLGTANLNAILVFIAFGTILFIPTRILLKKGREYMKHSYDYGQNVVNNTQRLIDNLFLIKILGTDKYETTLFKDDVRKFTQSQLKNYKFGTINTILPNFVVLFSFSVLIILFNLTKYLTIDFMAIVIRMVQSLGSVNSSLNMLFNSQVHIVKIKNIEDNYKISESFIRNYNKQQTQAITAVNVNFKYFNSEIPVFENLHLEIKKGDHVILTGQNGTGKSTLIGILSGTLNPDSGSVTINSDNIGYVGVKPLIIPDTLRSNLMYGNEMKIDDSILHDAVVKFKLFENQDWSLDNNVSNTTLSSGQFQKIAFMRAFISNVEILFLDESTSNLDYESKDLVFELLKEKNITIINSTHNPEKFNYDQHLEIVYEKNKKLIKQI